MNWQPARERAKLTKLEQAAFREIVEASTYPEQVKQLSEAIARVRYAGAFVVDGFQRRMRAAWRTPVG